MKKITFILLFFVAFANAQTGNYQVGDTVDDFTVTDTDGVEHNLYSITAQGKYVWLDFFFVDCGPCRATAATFNEFFDKYGCNEGDVYCLSINSGRDDDAYVEWYEQQFGGAFNHAPAASREGGGAAVTSNFGVSAFPTYCLVGPDNKLVQRDIYPISGVNTFENSFPAGFTPPLVECSLGLDDTASFDFSIHQNSSDGNLNINLPRSMESQVTIFNTLGQEIFQNSFSEKNISLNLHVSQGIYLVKITADNSSVTKRIILK